LGAEPGIGLVQPNFLYRSQQHTEPRSAVTQYALQKISVGAAHQSSTGRDIIVAVIDTGSDPSHPDLASTHLSTRDVIGENVEQDLAHGTAIAGIIGARGVTRGIAPDSHVISIRAFASFQPNAKRAGSRSTSMVILNALDLAVASGARILNLSFAGPHDPLVGRAIGGAAARNIVIVAAAGNGGESAPAAYPAAYPMVIAVTAIDQADGIYRDANRGEYIALAAPGVDVLAASLDHGYELVTGTSFATAHVSGLIALLMQVAPDLSPLEIRRALEETARDLGIPGRDKDFGSGLANAAGLLRHELVMAGRR
jgi:subtilisin family serine protease